MEKGNNAVVILLLFIVGAIGVPVMVETIRRPEDNLVKETSREVREFIVQPLQTWSKEAIAEPLRTWKQETIESLSLRFQNVVEFSLFSMIKSLLTFVVQVVKNLFKD